MVGGERELAMGRRLGIGADGGWGIGLMVVGDKGGSSLFSRS